MFKKTKIAMATAAMLASVAAVPVAEAVSVNPDGEGQVLIFPYYNTNNNFQTSFNIRNTKNEYKALKIRLRESGNSNDVLDFNVYMSPYDEFTFTVSPDGSNNPILRTTDKTCTYPTIPSAGVALKGDVYKKTTVTDAREGYVEVLEMGVIDTTVKLTKDATIVKNGSTVVTGLLHDSTGTPKDCSVVGGSGLALGAWSQGGAFASVTAGTGTTKGTTDAKITFHGSANPTGFLTPTGGLAGTSILLDVTNGAAFVADPTALVNYAMSYASTTTVASIMAGITNTGSTMVEAAGGALTGAQYYKPDDAAFFQFPSLASGNAFKSEVVSNASQAIIQPTWSPVISDWGLKDPNAILVNGNPGVATGINPFPVAHALAATAINNEYFIDSTFDGATDWVVTFPMRKHGIFNGYYYEGTTAKDFLTYKGVDLTGKTGGAAITVFDDVLYSQTFYDREEQVPVTGTNFSPVVSGTDVQLEREVNILSFANTNNATNKVLGSSFSDTFTLETGFTEGWAQLTLKTNATPNTQDYDLNNTNPRWKDWTLSSATTATAAVIGGTTTAATAAVYLGVPTMSFAAIRGNTGDTSKNVGETIPAALHRNRNSGTAL